MGDKAYLVGGMGLSKNEEYDPATNSWSTKAAMPTARRAPSAAVLGGKAYVAGGYNGIYRTETEEYDPALNTWTTRAAMPTGRAYLAAAAVIGGKAYVAGGFNGSVLSTNEDYDPASDSWSTKAPMLTGRSDLASAAIGGKAYFVGNMSTNEEFDPGVASAFTALSPNKQYTFKAKARSSAAAETAESPQISTYTLAAASTSLTGTFPTVGSYYIVVQWSSGTQAGGFNGPGATYLSQASLNASFAPVAGSSLTANIWAAVPSLNGNSLYYFRVLPINTVGQPGDYFYLGSTRTLPKGQLFPFD